jgi:hypothetical protein
VPLIHINELKLMKIWITLKNASRLILTLFICTFAVLHSTNAVAQYVTLLPVQQFTSSSTPTGWTLPLSCNTCGQWYWSSNGDGGSNGSVVCDVWDYATNPMKTPAINTSSYANSSDSVWVDFDFCWQINGYNSLYSNGNDHFQFLAGEDVIKTFVTSSDYTYSTTAYDYDVYPPTTTSSWRHYHFLIPVSDRTSNMIISWQGEGLSGGQGLSNPVIDNVSITGFFVPPSELSLAPKSLSFGNLFTGQVDTLFVTASSVGPATLKISGAQVSGNPDFTIISGPQPGDSILSGNSAQFGIRFSPLSSGTRTATFTLQTNGADSGTQRVTLTGQGITPAVRYGVSSLFRNVKVRLGDSATQYIPVSSTGLGPLSFSSIYVIGLNPGNYFISYMPQNPLPTGQSDSIGITFAPTMEGRPDAAIVINTNASNNPHDTVQMVGIGTLQRLVINNAYSNNLNLNFDSVNVGTTVCQTVILYNPGSDTVAVTRNFISRSDYDFTMTPLTGTDTLIAPEQSKQFAVCFTPLRNGYRTATVLVMTNIPLTFTTPRQDTSQFTINLFGTGVPFGHIALSAASLVDTTIVGTQICTSTTLTNTGTTDVTITAASFSGTSASAFVFSGATFPLTLAPGAIQVVTICGTPAVRGDNLATLSVTGTTNGQPINSTIPVDVVGLSVCASATPAVAFNSSTCLGDMPDTATITLTNCGDVATTYAAAIVGNSASDYHVVGSSVTPTVASNGTATFQIVYTPTNIGISPATVNLTGGTNVTPMSVQLNGSANAAAIAGSGIAPVTDVGATSGNFSVTVNNTGGCEWTPGVPPVSAPFTYVSGGLTPIPAGGNTTLMFMFSPTVAGAYNQTLTFPNAVGVSVPPAYVTISGTTSSASVSEKTSQDGFTLGQSYPNPFHGQTQVTIGIPQESTVRMDIVNQAGEVVESVMNQRMGEGSYTVTIDASNLASGTYYYSLTSGNVRLTRQMVLVK